MIACPRDGDKAATAEEVSAATFLLCVASVFTLRAAATASLLIPPPSCEHVYSEVT